jgi:hypothetical protein
VITGDRLGPAFTVPARERDLSVDPAGARAAVSAGRELIVFDIARATSTVVHTVVEGCAVDEPVWSPSGETIFFAVDCEARWQIASLRLPGEAHTLAEVDGAPIGLEPLGDDEVVYATVDYQSRLVLVDDLPTATSAE